MVNLASVAGLYLTLRAEFLATAQVIVYAGAIAVLFVFAIMVLIPGKEETGPDPLRAQRWLAVPVVGVFLAPRAALDPALRGAPGTGPPPRTFPGASSRSAGCSSPTILFPFEVTSLLLLAAIVGVMALTKRKA